MRLLYFAPHQIWPTNTGARLRDYQLARQLAARCSVTFVECAIAGEAPRVPPDDSGLTRSSLSTRGGPTLLQDLAWPGRPYTGDCVELLVAPISFPIGGSAAFPPVRHCAD